jgi:hypothetical protein
MDKQHHFLRISESIPQHYNSSKANQDLPWSGTDNELRWATNWKNPSNRDFLNSLKDFQYSYNSHGFRTPEFNNKPCIIALGCSHTEGVGVAVKDTWPSVLEHLSGNTVYNLGVGGCGIDTVYRLLKYYASNLNTIAICIHVPPSVRFEIKSNTWETYSIYDTDQNNFMKTWFLHDENSKLHQEKAVAAIRWFCSENDLPLAVTYCNDDQYIDKSVQNNLGRDLLHHGSGYHINIGRTMHNQLTNAPVVKW